MRIAVVILNWNTEGFLREFLPGLICSCQKVDGAEVIVADNDSTDGSMKVMTELFPEIKTLIFDQNLGFTGGYNEAFRQLSESEKDLEYMVLINSDIEVTENWLEPLVGWMDSHPDCGACAPKLHSWQEKDKFEYAGAAGGLLDRFGYPICRGRVLGRVEKDEGQYDSPVDVFWATGACLMVRSSVFTKLGGLDDRFFAHMEEIDLCWRMQLEGWKVTVVPDSLVYHVGGGTLPSSSPFKLFLNYRNNLMMLDKNLAKTYALKYYGSGMKAAKAASKGLKKASHKLFVRMCMDWMSSAVYLLTFRKAEFKAVWKAHFEFQEMHQTPERQDIVEYLESYGKKAVVNGIYNRWIILQSMIHGKGIFSRIASHTVTIPSRRKNG